MKFVKTKFLDQWIMFRKYDFYHKSEGVTMLPANEAIVVLVDDEDWKSITKVEIKFKLASSKSVYSIINLLN
jgi:hypothetical protein